MHQNVGLFQVLLDEVAAELKTVVDRGFFVVFKADPVVNSQFELLNSFFDSELIESKVIKNGQDAINLSGLKFLVFLKHSDTTQVKVTFVEVILV